MGTNLYIRHAIGSRLLLDCKPLQLPFNISHDGESNQWRISIGNIEKEIVDRLVLNEKSLNIFFQDVDGRKDWYYASHSPQLTYHKKDRTLTIVVDSKMSYQT